MNDCIIWKGSFVRKNANGKGYGYKYDPKMKRMRLAHRLIYEENHGIKLKSKQVLLHLCDNPSCVNLNHLKLGTQSDNIGDCVSKRRNAFGEKHGSSKLTWEEIDLIKRLYATKRASQRVIAQIFNMNQATICEIIKGTLWNKRPIEKACEHPFDSVIPYDKIHICSKCKTFMKPTKFEPVSSEGT